jgi:hypothetical protein
MCCCTHDAALYAALWVCMFTGAVKQCTDAPPAKLRMWPGEQQRDSFSAAFLGSGLCTVDMLDCQLTCRSACDFWVCKDDFTNHHKTCMHRRRARFQPEIRYVVWSEVSSAFACATISVYTQGHPPLTLSCCFQFILATTSFYHRCCYCCSICGGSCLYGCVHCASLVTCPNRAGSRRKAPGHSSALLQLPGVLLG